MNDPKALHCKQLKFPKRLFLFIEKYFFVRKSVIYADDTIYDK